MTGGIIVEVREFDRIGREITDLANKTKSATLDVVDEWVKRQRDRLQQKPYPPERPGQRYVRTFQLRDSWRQERQAESRWLITDLMSYSSYVVQRGEQAWMHEGRWWTAEETIEDDFPNLNMALAKRYEQL